MADFRSKEILDRSLSLYGFRQYKELADHLGITPSAISSWISKNEIPFSRIVQISNETKCGFDWLIYGKEEKGRTLDPLESLALNAFNALDEKGKLQILSAMTSGSAGLANISQSSESGDNNYYSGDNMTITNG